MRRNSKINWELSPDKEELVVRIGVVGLLSMVLNLYGQDKDLRMDLSDVAKQILTEQEKKILPFLLSGMSNKATAVATTLEIRTVKFHVTNILRKFHVHTRGQLMMLNFGRLGKMFDGGMRKRAEKRVGYAPLQIVESVEV